MFVDRKNQMRFLTFYLVPFKASSIINYGLLDSIIEQNTIFSLVTLLY